MEAVLPAASLKEAAPYLVGGIVVVAGTTLGGSIAGLTSLCSYRCLCEQT